MLKEQPVLPVAKEYKVPQVPKGQLVYKVRKELLDLRVLRAR